MAIIKGLHHVTALARDARENNRFYTHTLGLRRVKKTVNFDAPDVYHLYYADGAGTPGTVMTYFPFPNAARGQRGTGEAATTAFAVPEGALDYWHKRLSKAGVAELTSGEAFGERRLSFAGPDGDGLALVETGDDPRKPWTSGGVDAAHAIRGFHSVALCLREAEETAELLRLMGYEDAGEEGGTRRLRIEGGNPAAIVDIRVDAAGAPARQGAGSVHHVAFAVDDRQAQLDIRRRLGEAGFQITPVIDRDYFYAVYFRSPGGVLFEIATNEPGFDRDEDRAHLGEELKLPTQHEHLRGELERHLAPIED